VKRTRKLPERWGELTAEQFVAAVKLWSGAIAVDEFLSVVLGIKAKEVAMMDDFQKWVLARETDFMQDINRPHNAFFLQQLPGSELKAPGVRLKGCTLQQYMTVDTFFSQYTTELSRMTLQKGEVTGDLTIAAEEYLDNFIAALYKKEDEVYCMAEASTLQVRRENVHLIILEEHLEVVRTLDKSVKQAIVLNYVLVRSWLCKAFPHLFPEAEEREVNNKARVPKPTNWLEVFDNFVGDNVAEMEKYQAMQATDAFRIMNRRIREAKKRSLVK